MKNLKEILNIVKKERNFEKKITNCITWKKYGYKNLTDDNLLYLLKRRFWNFIDEKFKIGPCCLCGKLTKNKCLFSDDGEVSYWDYCCKGCEFYLREKGIDL